MTMPFTYKEQKILYYIGKNKSTTFKEQNIFKNRNAFRTAMKRLLQKSFVKAKKVYLNERKTIYTKKYSLTFDGKFFVKTYLVGEWD